MTEKVRTEIKVRRMEWRIGTGWKTLIDLETGGVIARILRRFEDDKEHRVYFEAEATEAGEWSRHPTIESAEHWCAERV